MTSINPTSTTLGSEPLTPPPGVKLETPEQEQMYRAALEFERFFVQQLLKPMEGAGEMFGEEGGSGSTNGYQDLAQDQLTQAVLDGGGLGLAATLYGQVADAAGILAKPAPAAATDTDGGEA
jgi:Rod binding domain-containing protein